MSDFEATGRLARWDGHNPDLRDWSDEDLFDGLRQCGVDTDRERFAAAAAAAPTQASLEDDWLESVPELPEGMRVFVWMSVQELWERAAADLWPDDRMARMFAYLVDAEYAAEWASRFHAPTGMQVAEALETWMQAKGGGRGALDQLVEQLGMPAQQWPGQMLDAMREWAEFGNLTLAEKGGALMATALDEGHAQSYMAAALLPARMYDRARAAALSVPHDAPVKDGFAEMLGYLCLAASSAPSARYWLLEAPGRTRPRKSELTFAAEACREFVGDAQAATGEVPENIRNAALQAATQSCFYATMAFAGMS